MFSNPCESFLALMFKGTPVRLQGMSLKRMSTCKMVGAVASWYACSPLDQKVWVQALAMDIA